MRPRRPSDRRPPRPRADETPAPHPREIEIDVERAVAGGRMLARHEGQVVLVRGAIAGERVRVRVDRAQKGVWFGDVVDVLRRSEARRDPGPDPACGGMVYAHIAPHLQHQFKADIVVDAFSRIARLPVPAPMVRAGAERGYRMRVRLHVRDGAIGSFREGTHEVCDIAATGQALPATLAVVEALGACLRAHRVSHLEAVEIAENLDASQRVVHLECGRDDALDAATLSAVAAIDGLSGVSMARAWAPRLTAVSGVPWVEDPLSAFAGPRDEGAHREARHAVTAATAAGPGLRRHARAFFQANRFLAPALAGRVLARVDASPVVDLYAGVGLFALSCAAAGHDRVVAVEGDEVSAGDLAVNASAFGASVRVVNSSVESFLERAGDLREATLIVDPPRTGISGDAMAAILACRARRIVYVSCDVATMARDARRLVEAGYRLGEIEAFDLFPNTAHVEALASFSTGASPR